MTQVWEIPLPCSQKLVLLKLADNAHDDGLSARPGVSTIARACGLSERCVQYTLRDLAVSGLIAATQFESGGRGLVTEYRITLEKGATGAGERVQLVRETPRKGATGARKGATDDKTPKPRKEVGFIEPSRTVRTKARTAPSTPSAADPATGQDFVSFYVDECKRNNYEPSKSWRMQMGNQSKRLVQEKSAAKIQEAIRRVAGGHKPPGVLAAVLVDVESGTNGLAPTNGHNPGRSQNQLNADAVARRYGLNPRDTDPFGTAPDEPWRTP